MLAELVALCTTRKYDRQKCLRFIDELLVNDTVEVIVIDRSELMQGVSMLRQRTDKLWSLCDACSMNLMFERQIVEALTTDRHFIQAGLQALLVA